MSKPVNSTEFVKLYQQQLDSISPNFYARIVELVKLREILLPVAKFLTKVLSTENPVETIAAVIPDLEQPYPGTAIADLIQKLENRCQQYGFTTRFNQEYLDILDAEFRKLT
jgi:hypothetical protein